MTCIRVELILMGALFVLGSLPITSRRILLWKWRINYELFYGLTRNHEFLRRRDRLPVTIAIVQRNERAFIMFATFCLVILSQLLMDAYNH